jgi:hypothetical protein
MFHNFRKLCLDRGLPIPSSLKKNSESQNEYVMSKAASFISEVVGAVK